MSDFLNRKKVRASLIQYFKVISRCQKQIQTIQQKLISHPRFNPIVLYKKISKNQRMRLKDLKEYWRKKAGVNRQEGLKMYVIKYDLKKRDTDEITLEMFLQTLLPYTPNSLREVNDTILRQLQTQHIDMTVQDLYYKMVITATECLYMIRLLQRQIGLPSWQKVQAFMVQDIVEKGKRIDLTIKETTDVIYVRKWMELWTTVDEYEVLNMMRFFNGGDEAAIIKMFDNDVKIHMKCTCQHHQINVRSHFVKNTKSQSKRHSKRLNEDYFSSGQQSRRSKSRQKIRFYTQTQGLQKQNTETQAQQGHKIIYTSENQSHHQNPTQRSERKQNSIYKPSNRSNSQKHNALNLFIQYIAALVESEKEISFNRTILVPYKKEVQEILHDLLSKKKNWTNCEKILLYIERFIKIKKDKFENLIIQMGNTKIQNCVIFSLFHFDKPLKKDKDKIEKKKQLTPNEIMQTLAYVLYKFISTRNKLILFSEKLVKFPTVEIIQSVLKSIEKQVKKQQRIRLDDLKEFLMRNTSKPIGKQYLTLLMEHLGDGNEITSKSLIKVLKRQSQSVNQGRKFTDNV